MYVQLVARTVVLVTVNVFSRMESTDAHALTVGLAPIVPSHLNSLAMITKIMMKVRFLFPISCKLQVIINHLTMPLPLKME